MAKMGRPSAYRTEFVGQAEKLSALGATDMEIADFFSTNVRTISRWKLEHEDFCRALKTGKEIADERVTSSLYQRAIGYEQDAVKIFMPAGAKEPVYAPFREHVQPDTTAAIFWLKNRRPDLWREKHEVEHRHVLDEASIDELDRLRAELVTDRERRAIVRGGTEISLKPN